MRWLKDRTTAYTLTPRYDPKPNCSHPIHWERRVLSIICLCLRHKWKKEFLPHPRRPYKCSWIHQSGYHMFRWIFRVSDPYTLVFKANKSHRCVVIRQSTPNMSYKRCYRSILMCFSPWKRRLESHHSIGIELAYTTKEAVGSYLCGTFLLSYSLKICREKLLLLLVCLSNHGDALSSLLTIHVLELSHNFCFINRMPGKTMISSYFVPQWQHEGASSADHKEG